MAMTSKRDREEAAQFQELKDMGVIGQQQPEGEDPLMGAVRKAQAFQREADEIMAHAAGDPPPSPPAPDMLGGGAQLMLAFETPELRKEFESWMNSTEVEGGWPSFGTWRDAH
jgi:hypothetical protein